MSEPFLPLPAEIDYSIIASDGSNPTDTAIWGVMRIEHWAFDSLGQFKKLLNAECDELRILMLAEAKRVLKERNE